MWTLANSENPDEISNKGAFHQGLHYLLRQKESSAKKYNVYWEIITFDPSVYTMDYPKFIVSNHEEESISA